MRKDVREFIRRLEAVGLTVESTPGHYRWTTPSSVTFSLTTIFPIQVLLSLAFSATTVCPRKLTYRLGP
jgi:hypothetical protein